MIRTQELKDRYSKVEVEVDSLGRTFTVGLLTPSQRNKVFEMTDSTSGYVILNLLRAASVRKVAGTDGDDVFMPFPRDRAMLDSNLDIFDAEGMTAISKAMARLDPPDEDGNAKDVAEEAKN